MYVCVCPSLKTLEVSSKMRAILFLKRIKPRSPGTYSKILQNLNYLLILYTVYIIFPISFLIIYKSQIFSIENA